MTAALLFAAALTVAIGVAHSILGERYILIRLFRREDLPAILGSAAFTRRTLRFAWHVTTIAWWGFGAILVHLALGTASPRAMALVVGVTFCATGAVALAGSRGRHLSWPVFFAIGGIALAAAGM